MQDPYYKKPQLVSFCPCSSVIVQFLNIFHKNNLTASYHHELKNSWLYHGNFCIQIDDHLNEY